MPVTGRHLRGLRAPKLGLIADCKPTAPADDAVWAAAVLPVLVSRQPTHSANAKAIEARRRLLLNTVLLSRGISVGWLLIFVVPRRYPVKSGFAAD
jgi:hypothetical protein